MELLDYAEPLKDVGLAGVLIVGIWLFIKGKIVPKQSIDDMEKLVTAQTTLLAQEITKDFMSGMKDVVKEGVKEGTIAAVEHLNGGS